MTQYREQEAQSALLDWAAHVRTDIGTMLSDHIIAIPNGALLKGDARERARQMQYLKQLGLMPGASDLFIALPRRHWHGFWLEAKKARKYFPSRSAADRALTDAQRRFGERMLGAGYLWMVCYGIDEMLQVVQQYVRGEDPKIVPVA